MVNGFALVLVRDLESIIMILIIPRYDETVTTRGRCLTTRDIVALDSSIIIP